MVIFLVKVLMIYRVHELNQKLILGDFGTETDVFCLLENDWE